MVRTSAITQSVFSTLSGRSPDVVLADAREADGRGRSAAEAGLDVLTDAAHHQGAARLRHVSLLPPACQSTLHLLTRLNHIYPQLPHRILCSVQHIVRPMLASAQLTRREEQEAASAVTHGEPRRREGGHAAHALPASNLLPRHPGCASVTSNFSASVPRVPMSGCVRVCERQPSTQPCFLSVSSPSSHVHHHQRSSIKAALPCSGGGCASLSHSSHAIRARVTHVSGGHRRVRWRRTWRSTVWPGKGQLWTA